jgi:Fe-S cluster assembly protein SufD
VWRYSGIDSFDLDAYAPAPTAGTPQSARSALACAVEVAEELGPRSVLVVTHNGACIGIERSAAAPDALTVATIGANDTEPSETLGEHVGTDAFVELHQAFVPDITVVQVSRKVAVADPVVIIHLVDAADPGALGVSAFPRAVVRVAGSAEVGVIELVAPTGTGDGLSLVVPVTELDVAEDAHLRYAGLQVLGTGATVIARQSSRVNRDGTLRSFTAGLGGRYARVRTDSELLGTGGNTSLLAAYLGTGAQVHDFRTLQDHHAGRTESELLFKGAVSDTARSVYSGLIRIRKGARGANAFQTNHNLVLSTGAHADSVPNLDIDENDVRCSHASTVGPIDEDQRYYLESRGIEPAVAERMIVMGFFSDIATRAPFPTVGRWVEDAVRARLTRSLGAVPGLDAAGLQSAPGSGPQAHDG